MTLAKTRASVPVEQTKTRAGLAIQIGGPGAQAAKQLGNFALFPGNLIRNQRFVVGSNTYVTHMLGRVPAGYILCNIRTDPTQAAATAAQGCQRNTTADPSNDETTRLSLGPWQPFLADVYVY